MNIKTDYKLGLEVQNYLISKNLEVERKNISDNRNQIIEQSFQNILNALNLTSSEFEKTPTRVAKMFSEEVFSGLDYNNFPACSAFENEFGYDGIVKQKNINIMSFCEHHFMPFEGTAEISFIPKDNKIIGLSNLDKICDFFSRRPQIQERLTLQIFETIKFLLNTDDVSVKIIAKHSCVSFRGENTNNSITETSKSSGIL